MFIKYRYLTICFLLVLILAGCNNAEVPSFSLSPSSELSVPAESEVPGHTNSDTTINSPSSSDTTSIYPEISEPTKHDTASSTAPVVSETESDLPITTPESKPVAETSSETTQPQKPHTSAAKITISLLSYQSANEPTPYVKGRPIYQVLYSGKRAQVGDTLSYALQINPANHSDKIFIDATSNVSCKISGTTLTVTVLNESNYNTANITIYTAQNNSSRSTASVNLLFTIDQAQNPYNNLHSILGEYITIKGMTQGKFDNGYTAKDPSLSITKYPGAPKWDDEIKKSDADWLSQCFTLIDAYADMGIRIVNFIYTDTSVAFCGAYN